jgi:hypothetical protein
MSMTHSSTVAPNAPPTVQQPVTEPMQPDAPSAAETEESTADVRVTTEASPNAEQDVPESGRESQLSKKGETKRGGDEPPDPMAARLEEAFYRSTGDLLEKIKQQRDFGLLWNMARVTTIRESGLKVAEWVAEHVSFSHQFANACGRLAKMDQDKFLSDHEWYKQTGFALGFRAKKHNGYDYVFSVTALRKRFQEGKPPEPVQKEPKVPPARLRIAELEQERDAIRGELERVVSFYRSTPQGEGFESAILHTLSNAAPATEDHDGSAELSASGQSQVEQAGAVKPKKRRTKKITD